MSLYNMMNGQNKLTPELMDIIGVSENEVSRFRDIWINEDGTITLYTRTGGGNDECYCDEGWYAEEYRECEQKGSLIEYAGKKHLPGCYWLANRKLEGKPNYVPDSFEYDDFDVTYASFKFKPLPGTEGAINTLLKMQSPDFKKSLQEKTFDLINSLEGMKPEEVRKKYPEIAGLMDTIMNSVKKESE